MKESKNFIKTILLSVLLMALAIGIFFLTKTEWDNYKIVSCVIVSIWSIFLPASYRFGFLEIKSYLKSGSYNQIVFIAIYIIELLLLPLALAPLFFIRYFLNNYKYYNKD